MDYQALKTVIEQEASHLKGASPDNKTVELVVNQFAHNLIGFVEFCEKHEINEEQYLKLKDSNYGKSV